MNRPFTIAVDANPLTRPSLTGTEVYARELARRLPAAGPELEWVFYASRPGPAIPGLDLTVLPGNPDAAFATGFRWSSGSAGPTSFSRPRMWCHTWRPAGR